MANLADIREAGSVRFVFNVGGFNAVRMWACGGCLPTHARGGAIRALHKKRTDPKASDLTLSPAFRECVSIQVTTFALLSLHAGSKIDQQAQCTKSLGRSRVKFLLRNS